MPALTADRWCLDGVLTVGAMAEWHGRLAERTATANELELDLAGVTAADVFGLQLLVSARRSATEGGRVLRISNLSPAIQAAAASAGFPLNF